MATTKITRNAPGSYDLTDGTNTIWIERNIADTDGWVYWNWQDNERNEAGDGYETLRDAKAAGIAYLQEIG